MQTKYYLSFEQVGIIRRIPLKEQDPDMQGILDAFIKAFRIANELGDEEEVTTPDLINLRRQSIQLPFLVYRTSVIFKIIV